MSTRPASPPYRIAPGYLAGPDALGTRRITDRLVAYGFTPEPFYEARAYARRDPHGLLEALQTPRSAPDPTDGEEPHTDWEFTARTAPGRPATWRVRFAPTTPPELPAALATALTAQAPDHDGTPHYLHPPGTPEEATAPLAEAGWMRDLGRHECAWYAPGQQAVLVTPLRPDAHGHGGANWLLAARRATDHTALWYATAHPRTPTHLIRALCTQLTDPTPVPRTHRPDPDVGPLTVTHP
ncbi:DUF317 domain-containing protein [Streptomyces sp. NPDC059002]|uniref:DUF317 domain-containing protein n=1 Tax=Streptomyces sp. NPDC059002 TaxID=3346690 RepID=UPI003689E5EC